MKAAIDADWAEIERLVRTSELTLAEIADKAGIPVGTVRSRASRQGWQRPRSKPLTRAQTARKALIRRFYKAIEHKLRQMETRMEAEAENRDGTSTAADHERDARTIGGLINQFRKLSEFEADLDRPADGGDATATRATTAAFLEETERYRRELAERLAGLLAPLG